MPRALHNLRKDLGYLRKFLEAWRGDLEGASAREKAMADHVLELLADAGPGAKVIVWAHNTPVAQSPNLDWAGIQPLGGHLRAALGSDYLALGFTFEHGSFLGRNQAVKDHPLQTFTVAANPEGTLDAALALAGAGRSIQALDLRRLPSEGQ